MERGWLCCLGQEEQRGAEEVSKRDTRIRTMGKWMADSKQAAPNGQTGFLAQGVRLEGTLELASAFRIDGEVKGPVRCQERLVLGENGWVEGEIEAAIVSVAGRVSGSVTGRDRVEILPSGVVEGEVYTPSLVIEAGGVLEGHCHMRADGKPAKAVRPPDGATPRPSGSRRAARN